MEVTRGLDTVESVTVSGGVWSEWAGIGMMAGLTLENW